MERDKAASCRARAGVGYRLLALGGKPGHPVYERIGQEIEGERSMRSEEVLASINAVVGQMRERRESNMKVIAETGGIERGAAGDDAGRGDSLGDGDPMPSPSGPR